MVDLQWEIESGTQALGELVAKREIDESAALAEAERLMRAEQELKKAHLALLIRIKNQLTPTQQSELRERLPEHVVFFHSRAPELRWTEPLPPP